MAQVKSPPKKINPKPQAKKPSAGSTFNPAILYTGLLVALLIVFSYIRIRLSSFPLERDEGEYAYFGQLILHGIPPYKMAYNLKLPGTYYCYALIMGIFGQTVQGIRIGLLLFDLGSLVFLYFITRKLLSEFAGIVAVGMTAFLFVNPTLLGQAAHATHFVTFFAMGGTWLLILAMEKRKFLLYLASGVMMGLAFLSKQSGLFFPLFGGLAIIIRFFFDQPRKVLKSILYFAGFAAGVVVPVAIVFLVMAASGVFDKFWFWTFVYPQVYGGRVALKDAWPMFKLSFLPMAGQFTILWIASGLGIIAAFLYKGKLWNRVFLLLFLVFSFLNVVPGFYFRQHYFIPFLPAAGIFAGMAFEYLHSVMEKRFRYIPVLSGLFFIIILVSGLNAQKEFYFLNKPDDLCRVIYNGNYFNEAIPVAKYIRENTSDKDTIFILGSEPEILFYSKRISATGYVYMYDLVFDQPYKDTMQQEMIREVEASKPKYMIFVSCPYSWLVQPNQADTIFNWFNRYAQQNRYIPVGVVEYQFPEPSIYAWNNDALTYQRKSDKYIYVLKRGE